MKYLLALIGLSSGVIVGAIFLGSTASTGDETAGQCRVFKAVTGGGCCGATAVADVSDNVAENKAACCGGKPCDVAEKCCGEAAAAEEAEVSAQLTALEAGSERKGLKIECPVMGGPAKKEVSADYRGGKVFFCCPDCIEAFQKNKEKYAPKANQQLVLTKQYVQKACPLSGRSASSEQSVKVANVDVHFCCKGCVEKIEKMTEEERFTAVFGDKGFEKGFEPRKKEEKKQG